MFGTNMDDKLLPREVPEPTRFPSILFEPCVPDASLVFGCGLFEAPKASAKVMKTPHETSNTEDILRYGIQEKAVPSWIKAYKVETNTVVDPSNFEQSDHQRISADFSERRPDFEEFGERSAENFSGRTSSGPVGAGNMCVGQKTGDGTRKADRLGYKNSVAVQEMRERGESFGKSTTDNFLDSDTDPFAKKYQYGLKRSKVTNSQTRVEMSDRHYAELQEGTAAVPHKRLGDVVDCTGRPTQDLPDITGVQCDSTVSATVTASGGEIQGVEEERGSFPLGHSDQQGGVARYVDSSDRVALGGAGYVASDVSGLRVPQAFDFQKEREKSTGPHKGFISSDCSLSDGSPLSLGRRRRKRKNKLVKESDLGSVPCKNLGINVRERELLTVGNSEMRDSPRRAKRGSSAGLPITDFGNARTAEGLGGSRVPVSDPLIRALFHLQNRHTELLLKLAADVGEVAHKQRRMFDVFQKLQSAFCDSGTRTAAEVPVGSGGVQRRHCDKCTQTSCDGGDRVPVAVTDAWTQSGSTGGTEGSSYRAGHLESGVVAVTETESGGSHKTREGLGGAVCAVSEGTGHLAESGTCIGDRLETTEVRARVGSGATWGGKDSGKAANPGAVWRLIGAVRSIAARVEESGSKTRHPSGEAGTGSDEAEEECGDRSRQVEVAGLVAAMRSAVLRYENNEFIKAPKLEDVAEVSENSSDSEDGEASEVGNESLTIGDLSLVPQNVSLSPDPSLRIDSGGLEISSDALAIGSDDSETEVSAHSSKMKEGHSENTDMTAVYLYRNIFSKVQEILDHSKTASEGRRDSSGKKPSTSEAENGRTKNR
ncbi:uncharacterized protein LOC124720114 isoform X1 [Schistocerca piceifrons]|uniref:uncharacterized protein LOC124720114 isoform X1 n=3 Tax=Schistocerca piceifrons TaxID=274613 RepID=UPI001F5F440C|nr:uncharacterized protein LOC124720114 isoform X1 [Schistocerca piceifrons]